KPFISQYRSPFALMVLQLGGCGRVGDCRNNFCGEGRVRVGRGPFLYSWVLFIHGRGCCLPPFVSRAGRPRRVLCVGHPHCVWAWWALAAMALTPTGAVADASTTAPVLRD